MDEIKRKHMQNVSPFTAVEGAVVYPSLMRTFALPQAFEGLICRKDRMVHERCGTWCVAGNATGNRDALHGAEAAVTGGIRQGSINLQTCRCMNTALCAG